ncbi:DNA-processing protein DprA [candidate division FCPU426 bacterium]|nr:DNA-processing protein DprA [candidate division FCPU426 bacterium]
MHDHSSGWIALNCLPGIGPVISQVLNKAFGSPAAVFSQPYKTLVGQKGIGDALARLILQADWKKLAAQEREKCRLAGIRLLTLADNGYPALLRHISCPPPVLYLRGQDLAARRLTVAVVGSRRPSLYGLSATRVLVQGLARAGATIVSGLAHGIDGAAHQAALHAGAQTLAVVAHGLDTVYPPEHQELLERICAQGSVISEFPLGVPPLSHHFPRRNRIISGLSQGVLVIEARQRSGALITARWAAEQGREVFAVPGSFQSGLSCGTHALIQDGAKLVTSVDDILSELAVEEKPGAPPAGPSRPMHPPTALSPEQARIKDSLGAGACHIDQLAVQCRWPVQQLMLHLLSLELKGLVKSGPGQVYQWLGENP